MKNVVVAAINNGKPFSFNYIQSVSYTAQEAHEHDVIVHFDFAQDNIESIQFQRNTIANRILKSPDIDGVLFTLPQIAWNPKDFFKLVEADEDQILSGAYPENSRVAESYQIVIPEVVDLEVKVLEAISVPFGFVYVPRKVLEGLTQFVEKVGPEEESFYLFFQDKVDGSVLQLSTDRFCALARSSGFRLSVDPTINCVNSSIMDIKTDYQHYLARHWLAETGKEVEDMQQN